jgi:hypothetical protein
MPLLLNIHLEIPLARWRGLLKAAAVTHASDRIKSMYPVPGAAGVDARPAVPHGIEAARLRLRLRLDSSAFLAVTPGADAN